MTQNKISKYFNPWHHVSYGDNIPQFVNTIIEIPEGSKAKYELDKKSGLLKLDRVLFSAVHYPANYGFIPRTLSDDEDPLDILVICSVEVDPLCLIEAKVIGVMEMLGVSYYVLQNNDEAIKWYKAVLKYNPKSEVAKKGLRMLSAD